MTVSDGIAGLEAEVAGLEASLGEAAGLVAAFEGELKRLGASAADSGRDVERLTSGFSRGVRRAFEGVAFDGQTLAEALKGLGQSMLDTAYKAAVKPVTRHIGGLLAHAVEGAVGGAFADGAGFSQGRVMPFATGGVVSGPVRFPMRGGVGLMGEAGPEAIMPLSRGMDGRLGVRAEGTGARPVQVVVNVSTPDVQGFRRSQSQIAAEVGRAIQRGARNR